MFSDCADIRVLQRRRILPVLEEVVHVLVPAFRPQLNQHARFQVASGRRGPVRAAHDQLIIHLERLRVH